MKQIVTHFVTVKETVLIQADLGSSAITALDLFDMSGEGRDDLLVGRRDGTVEVFSIPEDDDSGDADAAASTVHSEMRQLYSENFLESISSIQGGCVGSNDYTEVIVSTYTGRVFGLTTQCIRQSLSDNNNVASGTASLSSSSSAMDVRSRLSKLRYGLYFLLPNLNKKHLNKYSNSHEIDDLEIKVQKERERYQHSTQSMSDGISALPMLPINDSVKPILKLKHASF